MTDAGKNTTKITLTALGIVTAVVTLILAPVITGTSATKEWQLTISREIATLKECTRKLDEVPEKLAIQGESIAGIRATVDRLEKKLDGHVEKGK